MYEIENEDFSQLRNGSSASMIKVEILGVLEDILNAKVIIPGYSPFKAICDGYRSEILNARLPLPPETYISLVDIFLKIYYAGTISSKEIEFDPNSNKLSIRNVKGEEDANYRVNRSERKQTKETLRHFFTTA